MNPLHQFDVHKIIPLSIAGVDLSLTNSALFMLLAVGLSVLLLWLALRQHQLIPSKSQAIAENLYRFIDTTAKETIGPNYQPYLPFLFSVFIFILMGNLLGLIPMGFTFTSQLAPIGAFSLLGLIIASCVGLYLHRWGWFRTFLPKGMPVMLAPLIIPIELISFMAKPFSLTIRLVMNMIVGHILLQIMAYFTTISGLAGVFPFIFIVLMTLFELGIAFLQAYIYTVLTSIYLGEAVQLHS